MISLVQHTSTNFLATSTTFSLSYTSSPVNGDFLVLALWAGSAVGGNISSISQTGATWSKATQLSNGGENVEIWYAPNVLGAGTLVTINFNGAGSSDTAVFISEWSGMGLTGTLDNASNFLNNSGTNDTLDSGTTAPTTTANELWFAVLGVGGLAPQVISSSPSNGFTQLDSQSFLSGIFAVVTDYKIVNTTGAANTTVTTTGTQQNWTAAIATFSTSFKPTFLELNKPGIRITYPSTVTT